MGIRFRPPCSDMQKKYPIYYRTVRVFFFAFEIQVFVFFKLEFVCPSEQKKNE